MGLVDHPLVEPYKQGGVPDWTRGLFPRSVPDWCQVEH